MTNQKESLENIKLFVLKLLNEEQNNHSKNIETFKKLLGPDLGQDTIKIVNEIFRAKSEVLNKVYDKIQELQ